MGDFIFILLTTGFFALVAAYLKGCEAIVGIDDTLLRATEPDDASSVDDAGVEVPL